MSRLISHLSDCATGKIVSPENKFCRYFLLQRLLLCRKNFLGKTFFVILLIRFAYTSKKGCRSWNRFGSQIFLNLCTRRIQSLKRNWNFYVSVLIFMRFPKPKGAHCCVSDNDRHDFSQFNSLHDRYTRGWIHRITTYSFVLLSGVKKFLYERYFQQFFT